jgi:hypothetical protein
MLILSLTDPPNPGQSVDVDVENSPSVAPGISPIALTLDGGGMGPAVDLVVQED